MNKLEIDSVTLEFGQRSILSDIYMCFETGHITGILGRNGVGKSCLLRIIYGTLTARYSSVRFNGQAVFHAFSQPEKIRYLPQSSFVPKYLPLRKVLNIYGCDILQFIADFPEFSNDLTRPFLQFSFGQKRLIETYLILRSDSEFVLLDEPFSYLMPIHVDKLKDIMGIEKKRKGIIITDHLYQELMGVTDTVYLISDGKSYMVKSTDELRLLGYIC